MTACSAPEFGGKTSVLVTGAVPGPVPVPSKIVVGPPPPRVARNAVLASAAPTINAPATDGTDPHGLIRYLKPAMDQADEFFKNGDIKPFCDGPCNPT